LAWKSCKTCEFDFCFQCHRISHNYLGSDDHKDTMVEPIKCEMCDAIACRHAKDKDFCLTCFKRLETSGVFRNKKVINI